MALATHMYIPIAQLGNQIYLSLNFCNMIWMICQLMSDSEHAFARFVVQPIHDIEGHDYGVRLTWFDQIEEPAQSRESIPRGLAIVQLQRRSNDHGTNIGPVTSTNADVDVLHQELHAPPAFSNHQALVIRSTGPGGDFGGPAIILVAKQHCLIVWGCQQLLDFLPKK